MEALSMTIHTSRFLLGASLALLVGAAGAQQYAPETNSRMPAEKGATNTMPAQPSQQPTDKMSADPNATSQGTAAESNTGAQLNNAAQMDASPKQSTPTHPTRKSATRQRETLSSEEKNYRQALRQCAQERSESQRDACLDNAIGQHEPNG
jgi:hypothetical protein